MTQRTKVRCRTVYALLAISSLITGILLYSIVATPDPGGIWDDCVPAWLSDTEQPC